MAECSFTNYVVVGSSPIVATEKADVLNTFFCNTVSNLNLPEYSISTPNYNKIRDPVLKGIVKYKGHSSKKAIERVPKSKDLFEFSWKKRKLFKKLSL